VLAPVARDETHPVIRWLMSDARKRVDPSEFLQAFADELCAAGLDVSRVTHGASGLEAFPPNLPACSP
jgi:adenylate cyclase